MATWTDQGSPAAWQALTPYVLDDLIRGAGYVWQMSAASGTSGATEPVWVPPNDYAADGTAAWSMISRWAVEEVITAGSLRQPTAGNNHYYAGTVGITGLTEPTWPITGGLVSDGIADTIPSGTYLVIRDSETRTMLRLIGDWTELGFRKELHGVGSGSFGIRRDSPNATEAILGQGNLVEVWVPRISETEAYGAFFIEPYRVTIASEGETGAEILTVTGRGELSYLERAIIWSESFVIPGGPVAPGGVLGTSGTGNAPGQLLRRWLDEWQHVSRPQQPIPLVDATDFDYVNDSATNAWAVKADFDELLGYTGDDGLTVIGRYLGAGIIDIIMHPDLTLQAFNHYGRDLTGSAFGAGVVRFVKGVNIAGTVQRNGGGELPPSAAVISGDDDRYETTSLATGLPVRETFIRTEGILAPTLVAIGDSELVRRLGRNESYAFGVAVWDVAAQDDDATGHYLPGPPGTDGDYWIGDDVVVHTGAGEWDLNEVETRIMAVVVRFDQAGNMKASVECGSVMP